MTNTISAQLSDPRFDYILPEDKEFIARFDDEMEASGYSANGVITPGYAGAPGWGKYMLIYAKVGVKSKQIAARIYLRNDGTILRLFLNNIDKHAAFIENAPEYIRAVFDKGFYDCCHCASKPNGICNFRKSYTLNGELREKCSGEVFQFFKPGIEKLSAYMDLFREFYPVRSKRSLLR
ncbi:MAG: hypothetical protein LBT88_02180 [Oscillospiraceae bacterium]|jgi:hypothetical protein|nr:hypothetical protein [Oscillospiraceae bacterium]